MKITAAVLHAPDEPFRIEHLELAEPGPGEVAVDLVATGMCHTDLSMRESHRPTPYPVVLGHEGAGVVSGLGPGVTGLVVGQPVVLSCASCGSCRFCRSGEPTYCEDMWALNFNCRRPDGTTSLTSADGGEQVGSHFFGQSSFATRTVATASSVVPVPESASLEILGPLGCGVQTGAGAVLNQFRPRPGQSFAVFGCGAVGLSAVLAAVVAGCDPIIGVDLHPGRRALAEDLGATKTIDGADHDLVGEILEATEGRGVDYSFDAAGAVSTFEAAVGSLAHRGTAGFVAAGPAESTATVSPRHLISGRTVTGILEGSSVPQLFIPELIELHRQGRFPFDRLIQTFRLDQINEAEQASHAGDVIKPVLVMR